MFKSLTVAKRLGLGYAAVVAIGIAIAAWGTITMRGLSTDATEMATDRMVKVANFTQLLDNLNKIGRAADTIVFVDNPKIREEQKGVIAELRKQNAVLLGTLDKTLQVPKGRELLKTIGETRSQYIATMDRALVLADKGDNAAAGRLMAGDVQAQLEKMIAAVRDSRTLQKDAADKLASDAVQVASFGGAVMMGLGLLMVALGATVAWLSSRSIRSSLGAEPAQLSDMVGQVANGNLNVKTNVAAGDTTSVAAAVERMQVALAKVVSSVRENSESVATASAQIAQGNQDLSGRTEQQASALQQTAATMEELGTTVRNNADSAKQANQLAQSASEVAAQGGAVVGKVVTTMQGINDSSRKIGDIISVIDGIAFQTNILALNAAVEAARAGEQGRGFAVVASEVRSLAQRSAEAAKEIKTLIGRSVEQVELGTQLVDQAGKTMGEIVGSIQRVSDIVAEITSASAEQSSGVSQVGEAVSQMDQATQQNAALVEQSAAAAESLRSQAQQLVQAVAVFQLTPTKAAGATKFVAPVAANAPVVERRSPERAKNVVRSTFTPKATPAAPASAPAVAREPAPVVASAGKTGTDDWETF